MFEILITLLIAGLIFVVVALTLHGVKLTQELEAEKAMHEATKFLLERARSRKPAKKKVFPLT
jgi:hypothetical protein